MIRLAVSAAFILGGLFVLGVATLGIFRFESVLNRIHVAAKCDTLGALLVLAGLTVLAGPGAFSLKLALVIAFLWLTNPVASHLVAQAEVATNERIGETCDILDDILDLDDIDSLDLPTVSHGISSSRRPPKERGARS